MDEQSNFVNHAVETVNKQNRAQTGANTPDVAETVPGAVVTTESRSERVSHGEGRISLQEFIEKLDELVARYKIMIDEFDKLNAICLNFFQTFESTLKNFTSNILVWIVFILAGILSRSMRTFILVIAMALLFLWARIWPLYSLVDEKLQFWGVSHKAVRDDFDRLCRDVTKLDKEDLLQVRHLVLPTDVDKEVTGLQQRWTAFKHVVETQAAKLLKEKSYTSRLTHMTITLVLIYAALLILSFAMKVFLMCLFGKRASEM